MEWIYDFIKNYGIIAIIIMIFLEYACFPVPSEILLPIAGALSINFSFPLVWLLSIIAGIFGSVLCYFLGIIGRNYIDKSKRMKNKLLYAIETYEKYQNLSVLVGRIIPLCRTYISVVAGLGKQKFYKFLLFSLIGIAIWNFILMYLGYIFYDNIDKVSLFYNQYKIFIFIFLIIFSFFVIIKRIKKA